MASMNFFDALGIAENATASQVRAAYLAKISAIHPDVTSDPELHRQASEVNAAYSVLRDEQQRARYRTEVRLSRFRAEFRARETMLRLGDGPVEVSQANGRSNAALFALSFAIAFILLMVPLSGKLFGSDRAQAKAAVAPCSYATAFAAKSCLSALGNAAPDQDAIPTELADDNAAQ